MICEIRLGGTPSCRASSVGVTPNLLNRWDKTSPGCDACTIGAPSADRKRRSLDGRLTSIVNNWSTADCWGQATQTLRPTMPFRAQRRQLLSGKRVSDIVSILWTSAALQGLGKRHGRQRIQIDGFGVIAGVRVPAAICILVARATSANSAKQLSAAEPCCGCSSRLLR